MADWIHLHDMTLDVVVGVTEAEQRAVQPLVIDLDLALSLEDAENGDLTASVNYAEVQDAVGFLAQHGQWRLIESFGAAVARLLLAPPPPAAARAQVDRVRFHVRKPTILVGAVPGITLERDASWCDVATRMLPAKTWLDTLVETDRSAAYRAHVEPDSVFEIPVGHAALILAGRLDIGGQLRHAGDRLARGEVGKVKAKGSKPCSLLLVGQPPLAARGVPAP